MDPSNEEIQAQLLLKLGKKISVFMISKSRGTYLSLLANAANAPAAPAPATGLFHREESSSMRSNSLTEVNEEPKNPDVAAPKSVSLTRTEQAPEYLAVLYPVSL
jgi:hypothetical protein